MTQSWEELRGERLSVFLEKWGISTATPQLIEHIAQYGTVDDFCRVIDCAPQPLQCCIQMYNHFPRAAEQWMVERFKKTHKNNVGRECFEVLIAIAEKRLPFDLMKCFSYDQMTLKSFNTLFKCII